LFLIMIFSGYICGILSKFISGTITYVIFFYAFNAVLVFIDLVLYFRNRKVDKTGVFERR
jgi:hypothetical protein